MKKTNTGTSASDRPDAFALEAIDRKAVEKSSRDDAVARMTQENQLALPGFGPRVNIYTHPLYPQLFKMTLASFIVAQL